MKKFLLSAVAILALTTVNAQEEEVTKSSYKPNAGDVTAEFAYSGGISNTAISYREGGSNAAAIRGRYFENADKAYRFGVYLGFGSDSQDKVSSNETNVDLAFGIEKHFEGTKNLSPYYGGEVFVGYKGKSQDDGSNDVSAPSQTSFGVKGVFGADYYFVQNVYIGAEAGLGLGLNIEGEGDPKQQESKTSFGVAPLSAGLKVGFVF